MAKKIPPSNPEYLPGDCGRKDKAQAILEYAIVILCLVLALLAMQVYLKRGMQGRLRQVGDQLGRQYSPRNTQGKTTVSYSSTSTTEVATFSERQLSEKHGVDIDLDGDGVIEDNVFATETLSVLDNSTTHEKGEERVGELE